jgi:signal transduction histidine kinase
MTRFPLPLTLLLASLGLTAIAVVESHRAAQSQRETADRAMRELASFAAWNYKERLELRFQAMLREALGAVNHGTSVHEHPPVPTARHLAHYLPFDPRCNCHRTWFGPNPVGMFAFELGEGRMEIAPNVFANPHFGWETDSPRSATLTRADPAPPTYASAESMWILDSITRATRATPRPTQGFSLALHAASRRIVAWTLMPTAWGDTMVYGVEYTRESLAHVISDVVDDPGLLPPTFTVGANNRHVVQVRVSDAAADPLYESSPGDASPYMAHMVMTPQFGGLGLDLFVNPDHGNMLVTGSVVPAGSRLLLVLGVLAIAAALSVVAVMQLRRETALTRMRSDFVANVSHELRTPLTQIRLFTETLRSGRAATPEQRDWSLGHIERETTRLAFLVDNVLRFEAGKRSGEAAEALPVDVAAASREVVEDFAPIAAARNVALRTRIEETPTVRMPPDALRRVLLNFLDNAVKYGPAGQTIEVDVSALNGSVVVAVADQGPGVPPSEREAIWQPFTRGSTGSVAAGSGIGLSVVREIADESGARAYVESRRDGRGARFVLAIPLNTRS